MHGSEKYALYHKKDPIVIAIVHLYKYIIFNSKPSIEFIRRVNGTKTSGSPIWDI